MARIFITRRLPGSAVERLQAEHEIEVWQGRLPPTREELLQHAADAEGLLTMLTDRIDRDALKALPNLRAISNYAVGFDNVDVSAAAERGIGVGNTPDVLTDATADLAFTLLMAAARQLPAAFEAARAGDWLTWEPGEFLGGDVFGATLGIIGLGRIGRAMARRAHGFGMKVVAAARDDDRIEGVERAEHNDAVLQRADFVSLHVPLTDQTRHLIDARALELMKRSAILINTARGEVVDQAALAQALGDGQIAGAALDVTTPEPLPSEDPLWRAPNLVITPHIGSATRTARARMAEMAVENLLAGLAGRSMPHQVPAP